MSQFSFNTSLFGNGSTRPPAFGSSSISTASAFSSSAPAFGASSAPTFPFSTSAPQDTPTVPAVNTNASTNEILPESVYEFVDRTVNNRKFKIISHENLLTLASEYYKNAENKESDIVDTLKSMICSSQYLFSERFKKEKMNLEDVQFKFRMLTQPESISRDELISKLFKTVSIQ